MSDDEIIRDAREAFERAAEAEAENRREALDDLKFARLGEQWPAQIKRERDLDGRPCLTINRLPAFIRQVVNDARQNKPAIVVHPVDDRADPATAEVFNGLIRHIEQSSDAEVAYDTALDFAVTGGFGYFRINTRYASDDTFDQDLTIERVANPFSIYGDPDGTAADSSDWNTAFVVDTLPKAAFEARWKGAEAVDWTADAYASLNGPWLDGERVMVAEHWRRVAVQRAIVALSDGQVVEVEVYEKQKAMFDALGVSVVGQPRQVASHKVIQQILTGAEVLETVEWAGKFIPIVPVYGEELHVDGRRRLRGLVRDAKDPQRMFNYWRTTSTELVALAPKTPFIGRKGAFETDSAKWATANTQSHAYIEYDGPEPPMRQNFAGPPAGAIMEASNASDDMKAIMGLYDASLGAASDEASGKAILLRQREGDVSTFHYVDNLNRAMRHAGRILIDLIPKVYATPRVVRVLGPDGQARAVSVNSPAPATPASGPAQPQAAGLGEVSEIEKIYDLTVGKYDLTVTSGPSFTSRREEAANQMIELIRAYPAAAPVIGDLLAKNLDWPGADEVAQRLQSMLPPQVKGADPQAQAAQAQMAKLAQALTAAKAEIAALQQDRSNAARKLEIDAFEAETNRLKAMQRVPQLAHEEFPMDSDDPMPGLRADAADQLAGNLIDAPQAPQTEDPPPAATTPQTSASPPAPAKSTNDCEFTFIGGAGTQGPYLDSLRRAFEAAGIQHPRVWNEDGLPNLDLPGDILSVPHVNDLTFAKSLVGDPNVQAAAKHSRTLGDEQYNLGGYSYGAAAAAANAYAIAENGGKIDHLVLVGAPINQDLYDAVRRHPNIKNVINLDLGAHGDPVHAGMSDGDFMKALPTLAGQFFDPIGAGHFYYWKVRACR